jgi:two-component system phosphate regulon sensor histidine kinase PhoR
MNIRTRIFLIVLSALSIGLLFSFIVAERDLSERIETQILNELEKQGNLILVELRSNPLGSDLKNLKERVDAFSQASNSRITFIESDGNVVADSDVPYQEVGFLDNHGSRPEIIAARENGTGWSKRFSATLQQEMIYLALKTATEDSNFYTRIAVPINYFETYYESLNNSIILIVVVSLIVAILASILAGNYTRESLHDLDTIIKSFTKRNYRKKDIKKLPVSRRDEIGSMARSVSAISTSLKQQISLLAKQRDQFGNLLDDIGQGVVVFTPKGRVSYANDEAHNILSLDNLIGVRVDSIDNKPIQLLYDQSNKKGKYAMEFEIDFEGDTKWILAQMSKSKSTGENILVLHDETQLRHLDSMRRDFISNLSHELRTPVSVIKANSETLLLGVESKKDVKNFSSAILHNANRLTEMVNGLIDLSRIEYGDLKFNHEILNINDEIKLLIERFKPVLDKRGMEIKLKCEESLQAFADKSALERILNNLLDNAIKYSPKNSKITIVGSQHKNQIKIALSDEGLGISSEDQKLVFSRFYRTAKARADSKEGSGLGLAITKHLVNQLHGEVGVMQNKVKGSTFWFTLPKKKK